MNEDQLAQIVAAAVQKTAEDLKAQFEPLLKATAERSEALAAKNQELLSDLKKQQGKPEAKDPPAPRKTIDEVFAEFEANSRKFLDDWEAKNSAASDTAKARAKAEIAARPMPIGTTDDAIVVDRRDVRDPARYRQLRDQAQKAGKRLQMVDTLDASNGLPHTRGAAGAPLKTEFTVDRKLYVHSSALEADRHAIYRGAEKAGLRVTPFKSEDQLPNDALAEYRRVEGQGE